MSKLLKSKVNKQVLTTFDVFVVIDESLPFYLILKLPPILTRSQAISYLLPSTHPSSFSSTSSQPHLSLSADLAFIDLPSSTSSTRLQQNYHRRKSSFVSSFNLDLSDGIWSTAPSSNNEFDSNHSNPGSPAPSTPTLSPSSGSKLGAGGEVGFEDNGKEVPLWSYVFGESELVQETVTTKGKGKGRGGRDLKILGEGGGKGRAWVGREGGEEGTGGWMGVWEFRGTVCKSFSTAREAFERFTN